MPRDAPINRRNRGNLFGVGVDGNPSRHDDVCPVFGQMI
jgi:hypothetical protein